MTDNRSRKAAIQEYKQRKPRRGAFAVRCASSGRVWVGASPNLDAARNATWFVLRNGSHTERTMQADWNAFGEDAFQFEILEMLDPDVLPMSVGDLLKEKKRHWAAQLSAPMLLR